MKINKMISMFVFRFIAATGMTIGAFGTLFLIWYVFFSYSEHGIVFSLLSLLSIFVGFVIFKMVFKYIYNGWGDYL